MKSLKILNNLNCYFAFQSNNMFDIEGHINCVETMEEFKYQLPDNADIIVEDEVSDSRGTRFTVIGKLNEKSDL